MKKLLLFIALCFTIGACSPKGCETWKRDRERRWNERNYRVEYYGMWSDKNAPFLIEEFTGYLHNDEGIDLWWIKGDTTFQVMRGDFGTTIVRSW